MTDWISGPGTPLGRLKGIVEFAGEHCPGYSPAEARPAEVALMDRFIELEAENAALRRNIDSAWEYAANGFEIESRAEAEADAQRMGWLPLFHLMHLVWKRNPKVESLLAKNAALLKAFEDAPHGEDCGLNRCSKCNGDNTVCDYLYADCPERVAMECDCWKSRIPDERIEV